jgi:uncharacterized protein YtpQ (UPF0354 family)
VSENCFASDDAIHFIPIFHHQRAMNRRAFVLATSLLTAFVIMFRFLSKNRPTPDAEDFRDRVLKLAKSSYPNVPFEAPSRNADVIIANGIQIGLQNLKAKFDQSDRSRETLEQLVTEHFSFVLKDKPSAPDFDAARQKLRPQIMPPEYAEQVPIISFPFGTTLAIGLVLDSDKGYMYLRREDALRWKKSHEELLDLAIANLEEASRGIPMQSTDNDEVKFVAVESKDGFDAARILLPKLREFLQGRLGSPFLFAVPNRDFLLCWNTGASARFSEFTVSKIQKDFTTQPYPLSPHVFAVASDGVITERG